MRGDPHERIVRLDHHHLITEAVVFFPDGINHNGTSAILQTFKSDGATMKQGFDNLFQTFFALSRKVQPMKLYVPVLVL
jgi:hypothetical protein